MECLVQHRGKWWHFFIKPFYGLCFRKKEGRFFSNFEVLLPEACEDFCAVTANEQIHIVCQDKSGSILYLTLEEETWRKTVLLESKTAAAYPKHFRLLSVSGFVNLFYTIAYKEKTMLVHQIITTEDKPPVVIDRIAAGEPPFSVCPETGTDLAVLYANESGITGTRLYRWSKKAFSGFLPVHPASGCRVYALLPEKGGRVRYAGFSVTENIHNLVYFEKTEGGDYTAPVVVYLDCPAEAAPVFCKNGEKLFLVWQESGGILSAYSADDGAKWSKPVRYVLPAGAETVCYMLSSRDGIRYAYGHEKELDIVFYGDEGLSEEAPREEQRHFRPAGYEAEAFAGAEGGLPEQNEVCAPDPITLRLKQELFSVKEQLLNLKAEVAALRESLSAADVRLPIETEAPTEE